MSFKLIPTPEFVKSVKKLAKRYRKIKNDLALLEAELESNPDAGTLIGHNCFKIRVQNSSVPTGKSAGFRVVYFFKKKDKLYLLEIYSKSDTETMSDKKIVERIKMNGLL